MSTTSFAAAIAAAVVVMAPTARAQSPTIENPIVVKSFDDVPLVATLMLPPGASRASPVPAVIEAHHWGAKRRVEAKAMLAELLNAGYAVLTWDSRGFNDSGGEVNAASPGYEGRDVAALVTYLASRPEIQLDGADDPRVAMQGFSLGGSVQYAAAAVDQRIDAIVPRLAWGDLNEDTHPNGVFKNIFTTNFFPTAATTVVDGASSPAGPQFGGYAPELNRWHVEMQATGTSSAASREWLGQRSTTRSSPRVKAATLIIQGSLDTMFPLEGAFANYATLRAAKTPVKLVAYCTEHGFGGPPVCPYPEPHTVSVLEGIDQKERILAWFARYLKRQDVSTGPEVEWEAQDGRYYSAPRFPLPGTKEVTGRVVTTGNLVGPGPGGGDELRSGKPAPAAEIGSTAARSAVAGPFDHPIPLVGIPRVRLKGSAAHSAAHVFFELIDVAPDGRRVTVDNQVMPLRLQPGPVDQEIDLHGVAWLLQPGHVLELEITTGSSQYQAPRAGPYTVSLQAQPMLPLTIQEPQGGARQRIRLEVRPRRTREGRATRFGFRATLRTPDGELPVDGAEISFAGRTVRTDAKGRATFARRFRKPGRYRARAVRRGLLTGVAYVRVAR